jgi:2-dehydro-3-deoxygluconokinase
MQANHHSPSSAPTAPLDLVTLGEGMVELYAEGSDTRLRATVGGDALNVAVAAARLGARVGFLTRLGDDLFAPLLWERCRAEGLDLSFVRPCPGFTGLYLITLDARGERSFTYYRRGSAASTLEPADLDPAYLRRARFVHSSGITQAISPSARAAVRRLAFAARPWGLRFSYDPNFRPKLWTAAEARVELRTLLPFTFLLLPSAGPEGQALWGSDDPTVIARQALAAGCEIVAVKAGPAGCVVGTSHALTALPAVRHFPVRDTTGAGDAFDAAFLVALARGATPPQAGRFANLVAALKCTGRGALGALPTLPQVAQAWPLAYGEPFPTHLFGPHGSA